MTVVRPVVLAGGNGIRLWPLSRASLPKPFLPLLAEGRSPFESAVAAAAAWGEPLVLCRDVHRFVAAEQIRGLGVPARLVLEPESRGDGAAIALAAAIADPDDVLLVLPSEDPGELPVGADAGGGPWRVGKDGERVVYDLVSARTVLGAVVALAGSSAIDAISRAAKLSPDLSFHRVHAQAWEDVPHLDLGILRRAASAVTVPARAGAQIADFGALREQGETDADGNVTFGDVALIGSRGCLVRSGSRLVTVVDGTDLAVIETADAVLVAPVAAGDRVRDLVALLETQDRVEAQLTPRVLRPWGAFEAIGEGVRWRAKRIVVQPGQALSLQRHEHRAEHWVVVRGTARVRRGDEVVDIGVDASTYIPRGTVHRLENPGDEPLVVVEVQTGDRLVEDDIERLEDRYGR